MKKTKKPSRGRPRGARYTAHIATDVPEDIRKEFDKIAEERLMRRADLLRRIVTEFVRSLSPPAAQH